MATDSSYLTLTPNNGNSLYTLCLTATFLFEMHQRSAGGLLTGTALV